MIGPKHDDICYGPQNRQDAVKKLLEQCDVLVVVGSPASSNSNRLREIAQKRDVPGYLVDGPGDLKREWFDGKRVVGVTAGASAPEILVQTVIARLQEWGGGNVEEIQGRPEGVVFSLPKALRLRGPPNAPGLPARRLAAFANRVNQDRDLVACMFGSGWMAWCDPYGPFHAMNLGEDETRLAPSRSRP